jgi:hypothetical protein
VLTIQLGGSLLVLGLQAYSNHISKMAADLTYEATRNSIMGGHSRQEEEWKHQEGLANKEIDQIAKQILAAELRVEIANRELENHDQQVDNVKEVDDFMRNKFTNQELYRWMVSQISGIYFQSYQLAYDVAKRAEAAYRFELGIESSNFVQFGNWDSLNQGLLAGERLYYNLKQMEMSYLNQNKREYELTKHISLALLDPVALIVLKETGECYFDLPEVLFDADYPGHYLRRIKSVGMTIPCVVGPYANINCTLTMLSNSVRRSTNLSSTYTRNTSGDDLRFADNISAAQSIATSGDQNDSGLFELNFRDERYLPFEGAGAITGWRIEMPIETNNFDRNAISDVVIHLRYTARDGGESLKNAAIINLPRTGVRLVSVRHEFPSEWYRFLHPASRTTDDQVLSLKLLGRFPFAPPGKEVKLSRMELFCRFTNSDDYKAKLTPLLDENTEITLRTDNALGGLHRSSGSNGAEDLLDFTGNEQPLSDWSLKLRRDVANINDYRSLQADEVEDILIICQYIVA